MMTEAGLEEKVRRWRQLPLAERQRRHQEAIPRYVANSMAMEGEPVSEEWLREQLADLIQQRATSKPRAVS